MHTFQYVFFFLQEVNGKSARAIFSRSPTVAKGLIVPIVCDVGIWANKSSAKHDRARFQSAVSRCRRLYFDSETRARHCREWKGICYRCVHVLREQTARGQKHDNRDNKWPRTALCNSPLALAKILRRRTCTHRAETAISVYRPLLIYDIVQRHCDLLKHYSSWVPRVIGTLTNHKFWYIFYEILKF